jgi:branched-chain amino acid aminotransferase
MEKLICLNGIFLPENNAAIGVANRSFRYGDGLFETIRMRDGQLFFIDDHFERLIAGMFVLGLDTTLFNPLDICRDILELAGRMQHRSARIRLHVYRNEGGAYCPVTDSCSYLITSELLTDSFYNVNEKGWRLGLYSEIRKPVNSLSGIKSSSALLYVLAARFARENNLDECLLLNEHGRICEAGSSNVFLVLPGKKILTPAVSEGILPGVMRKNLIEWMRAQGIDVEEGMVLTEDLYRAEEVFMSNSIIGVRWGLSFRERRYYSNTARFLTEALNTSVPV